jgi:hypothetical protein
MPWGGLQTAQNMDVQITHYPCPLCPLWLIPLKNPLKPFERLPMVEELPYDRLLLSNEFSGCGRLP